MMAQKQNISYKLLKPETTISKTSEFKVTFDNLFKALNRSRKLALEQIFVGKQLALMTDASVRNAGDALVIEDKPAQKVQSQSQTYAPVAFTSKIYHSDQLKRSAYWKEFWHSPWHFSSLLTVCWWRQQN